MNTIRFKNGQTSDKIAAIKELRLITKPTLGLKEAKEAIEEVMDVGHSQLPIGFEFSFEKHHPVRLEIDNYTYIFVTKSTLESHLKFLVDNDQLEVAKVIIDAIIELKKLS